MSIPNFERCVLFAEDLVAIKMRRVKVLFDKPIYIGQAILDISKLTLFDFHYGFMLKQILIYTDTDSLLYEIITYTRSLRNTATMNLTHLTVKRLISIIALG